MNSEHRFSIGDEVKVSAGFGLGRLPNTPFKVVALLPSNGRHFQYKIRGASEVFDRTVEECQVTAAVAK